MNKKKLVVIGLILIVVIIAAVTMRSDDEVWQGQPDGAYLDTQTGFSFDYPKGDKYVVQEPPVDASAGLLKAVIVIPSTDFEALKDSEEGQEGPPTINVLVFRNETGLSAGDWLDVTGVNDQSERLVGGVQGLVFEADGLYSSRNVVISNDGLLYFISGSFIDRDSDIYRDFDMVLDTFVFLDEVTISGGITSIEKRTTGAVRILVTTEIGAQEVIEIPQGGIEACGISDRLGDVGAATKSDIVQVRGERTSSGTVVPCNRDTHYFTIIGDSLPDTVPTSEQG